MIRIVLGAGLALHGLIHLIGFVVPWRIAEIRSFSYTTTAAWGRIELGDHGARALGLAWLVGTLAFLAAAAGVWQGASWAIPMTACAAALSLLLCIAGSPAAIAGLVIDVAILAALVVMQARPEGTT